MIVAIDGPAGAGKSTVAMEVAARLGFRYLDTGAMYRAVTNAALERGVDQHDHASISSILSAMSLQIDDGMVKVDGRDVSVAIRSDDVTRSVSTVAAHPAVRAALVPIQREIASRGESVVEGRDIGTAVFPDADVKIFLTATRDERARRRARQLEMPDERRAIDQIALDIERRDKADATRDASPLVQPEDAHVIDTTELTFDEVVDTIVRLVRDAR